MDKCQSCIQRNCIEAGELEEAFVGKRLNLAHKATGFWRLASVTDTHVDLADLTCRLAAVSAGRKKYRVRGRMVKDLFDRRVHVHLTDIIFELVLDL